jgi:hypothetical protein
MYAHRDTSAPPAGISTVRAARHPFLPFRPLMSALPLARRATAFGRRGRRARAS